MKRRQAFTLIELLVVIAIIALLVSILLPSLAKAKDLAKAAMCMSNLRNIGLTLVLYAEENDGFTPDVFDYHGVQPVSTPPVDGRMWHMRLMTTGYVDVPNPGSANIFQCPSGEPTTWSQTVTHPLAAEHTRSYGMRTHNLGAQGWFIGGEAVRTNTEKDLGGYSINFGRSSSFLFIGDSIMIWPSTSTPDPGHLLQFYYFVPDVLLGGTEVKGVDMKHNRKGNFVFADSHVETLSKADLLTNHGATIGYGDEDGNNAFIPNTIYDP